jgi:hypothetical protein
LDGISLLVELTLPIRIIMDAVLVLSGDVSVPLIRRLLAVGVLEMGLEVVGASEGGCLASLDPAFEETMFVLLMNGLLMPLLVFLTLEALLLPGLLVDASRIAAGKLVLGDQDLAVDARIRQLGRLGLAS